MARVEEFLRAPSEEMLEVFSCEQLVCIAEHFGLDVGDRRMKGNMKDIICANLSDKGFFEPAAQAASPVVDSVAASGFADTTLTFEARRELLHMQLELKRLEVEEWRLCSLKAPLVPLWQEGVNMGGNQNLVPTMPPGNTPQEILR